MSNQKTIRIGTLSETDLNRLKAYQKNMANELKEIHSIAMFIKITANIGLNPANKERINEIIKRLENIK